MIACAICNRACDRSGECPVCHGGGPYVGDNAEWYQLKAKGVMKPAVGRITEKNAVLGQDVYTVRTGRSGSGKEHMLTRQTLTRVTREGKMKE